MRTNSLILICCCAALLAGCSPRSNFDLDKHIGICGEKRGVVAEKVGLDYLEVSVNSILCPEESDEVFAQRLARVDSIGLPLYSANGFYPQDIVLLGPDAQMERAIAYGKTAVRRAAEAGMKVLVLGSGRSRFVPEGFERAEAEKQFLELLCAIAPEAEERGVVVAIEPLSRKETNFINTVREGAEFARRTGSPNIAVIADFYHMESAGEGPDAIIDCADKLVHCHIAEAITRTAPGVEGQNFVPYFDALKRIGYQGRISMECRWGDLETELPIAFETMKAQIRAAKRL